MIKEDKVTRLYISPRRKALFLGLLFFGFCSIAWVSSEDVSLHNRGKKFVLERKWKEAIETYSKLLEQYPQSQYTDDATFWIGFSYEQIPGKGREAFDNYQKVIDVHPNSSWADDALMHQIFVAKRLYKQGDQTFGEFLRKEVAGRDTAVRYQAALALGEARDPAVLSTLEEIAKGENETLAKQAMNILSTYEDTLESTITEDTKPLKEEKREKKPVRKNAEKIVQENLSKIGKEWTEEKLLLHGLYHIVPVEDLAFYFSLSSDWDRKEWLRKFWASRDPTPTTPGNEAEEEFKRRVLYAWENYGRDWSNDSHYYPPWDSRGEVYIKFGEPDNRQNILSGWEEWMYYKYRVNFMISNCLPNWDGEGVYLSTLSHRLYRENIAWKRLFFVQRPQFLYTNPEFENAKKIQNMDFHIASTTGTGSAIKVMYTYEFPASNLKFKKENEIYKGAYLYRWVLYDEDYHALSSFNSVHSLRYNGKKEIKESKVQGTIHVTLAPGSYIMALRIEDINSSTLGVFRKHFTVQDKKSIK